MDIDNYFEEQGSGPPIVFIHGSYASTSTWKKMVGRLAANHHCILIKLPGHCGTPDPEDFADPTIETELEILERVVNLLTNEPVHLVGHSFGGVIALAQALKGNLNLSQVSLFEPVAVWVLDKVLDEKMGSNVQKFLTKYRYDVSQETPYVCGQVIDFWAGEGAFESLPGFIKESMELLVANNIRHWNAEAVLGSNLIDLQECVIATRLICGSQSNPVAKAICDHLSKRIPNSKQYTIEGASHFLVNSHVNECLSALCDQSVLNV